MNLINNLKWRYATKYFDSNRIVSVENLQKIMKVIQLSASSYGLQLYKVLIVEDKKLREKLKAVSWEQNQIIDASHLFVFCNYTKVKNCHIDEYLELHSKLKPRNENKLVDYGDVMKAKIDKISDLELHNWTAKQTYLALANLLSACAELKIDACPMEGFEPEKYNEILGLNQYRLNAAVIATIGYRSEKDETQHSMKIRKPMDKLFEIVSNEVN